MRIDEGLDTGDILLQQRVSIYPDQTSVELSPILAAVGAELMVKTLAGLEEGILSAKPQEHSLATLAPILRREDGRIDWSKPAVQIYNRWRGFQPWPGAFTYFRGKKLSLHAMRIADRDEFQLPLDVQIGSLAHRGNRLLAACGEGTWLDLLEVQMEGKRRMPVEAFLNVVSFMPGERLN
jgi:methionyl-tRNA formyltransferase